MDSYNRKVKEALEKRGYICAIVERWNSWAKVRQDLLGFCDMLAISGDQTLYMQITSRSNKASRLDKIKENVYARRMIREGALVYLALLDVVKHRYRLEFIRVTPKMIGEKRVKRTISSDVLGDMPD